MNIEYSENFMKDFKILRKKYLSLQRDLDNFLMVLELDPCGKMELHNKVEKISGLGEKVKGEFYKVRKFVCKSIAGNSGNSGIRIMYRYLKDEEYIELEKIELIEIYHKNERSNHNIKMIKKNYSV